MTQPTALDMHARRRGTQELQLTDLVLLLLFSLLPQLLGHLADDIGDEVRCTKLRSLRLQSLLLDEERSASPEEFLQRLG